MRITIEDCWFPSGTRIRIGRGADELAFLRCSFEGGEIFVETEVDRTIFRHCVFHQTRFSGQPLSQRLAADCHSAAAGTEATSSVSRCAKFRR